MAKDSCTSLYSPHPEPIPGIFPKITSIPIYFNEHYLLLGASHWLTATWAQHWNRNRWSRRSSRSSNAVSSVVISKRRAQVKRDRETIFSYFSRLLLCSNWFQLKHDSLLNQRCACVVRAASSSKAWRDARISIGDEQNGKHNPQMRLYNFKW